MSVAANLTVSISCIRAFGFLFRSLKVSRYVDLIFEMQIGIDEEAKRTRQFQVELIRVSAGLIVLVEN